jgi:hypothetical protein
MRHPRASVSAIVSLIVALATLGSLSAFSAPQPNGRRRHAPIRVTRVGAQRLDHAEAVSHEADQHDPLVAHVAAGTSGEPLQVGAPPGQTAAERRAAASPAVVLTTARTATPLALVPDVIGAGHLASPLHGIYRPTFGRPPPRTL